MSIVVICKSEPALAGTLDALADQVADVVPRLFERVEILVVDASSGALEQIRVARPDVRWLDFVQPIGVRVTIPHQRNLGVAEAAGDIVVFTDCGCAPAEGWLAHLLTPILDAGERMTCGHTGATGPVDPYRAVARQVSNRGLLGAEYLSECSTINLAVCREVFDEVGGFDESFEYGSDTDFSWRAVHAGVAIRYVPEAIVSHDWGTRTRQLKRSYAYGKARARLLHKHVLSRGEQSAGRGVLSAQDLVTIAYPLFLLGLPFSIRFRSYALLLLLPLWRNRRGAPVQAVVDHLALGAGVLAGAGRIVAESRLAEVIGA